MSIAALIATVEELPAPIRDQVVGYARTVYDAARDICKDAGVRYSGDLADQLAFLAGIKKLYGLIASSYWTLDNSAYLLSSENLGGIRIGSRDLSPGSAYHRALRMAVEAMDQELRRVNVREYIDLSYRDMALALAANGSSRG